MSLDALPDSEPQPPAQKSARRRGFGPIALCFVIGFFAFVLIPVAWVLVYRVAPIPGTMLMVERAFEGDRVRANWVGLDRIDPALVRSAIGAEDSRFCTHDGFDVEAIQAALKANERAANQKRSRVRGGSTISQQTAKNVFAWADRSWARKGVETVYTALIEALWPKDRIMEAYLNVAEWGDGRFGAQAAAQGLFSVNAADISERQAAALAAVLPSPNRWNAVNPGRYVRARIGAIVSRARVVRGDGLASCVVTRDRSEAPARPRPRTAPPPLPPLPTPPPEEAPSAAVSEDQGVEDAASAVSEDAPPVEGEAPAPEASEPPTPETDALRPTTAPPPGE